jgi:hypothetical protein
MYLSIQLLRRMVDFTVDWQYLVRAVRSLLVSILEGYDAAYP